MYGIRKAPPPFWYAVNGNRHILPRPTDMAMQDSRNSLSFPHCLRSDFRCTKNTCAREGIKCLHSRSFIGIILLRINMLHWVQRKLKQVCPESRIFFHFLQNYPKADGLCKFHFLSSCISLIGNKDLIGNVAPVSSKIIWKASSRLLLSRVADLLFWYEG